MSTREPSRFSHVNTLFLGEQGLRQTFAQHTGRVVGTAVQERLALQLEEATRQLGACLEHWAHQPFWHTLDLKSPSARVAVLHTFGALQNAVANMFQTHLRIKKTDAVLENIVGRALATRRSLLPLAICHARCTVLPVDATAIVDLVADTAAPPALRIAASGLLTGLTQWPPTPYSGLPKPGIALTRLRRAQSWKVVADVIASGAWCPARSSHMTALRAALRRKSVRRNIQDEPILCALARADAGLPYDKAIMFNLMARGCGRWDNHVIQSPLPPLSQPEILCGGVLAVCMIAPDLEPILSGSHRIRSAEAPLPCPATSVYCTG